MSEVFNDYQNAFIKEKQISDNVLITNKAINIIKKREGKWYLFKLEFHEAFDSFLWKNINEVMAGMGFGNRWWGWIMQWISTTKKLVLVNGSPMEKFGLENGLHQKDPSSISFSFQQCKSGAELYVVARLIFGLD